MLQLKPHPALVIVDMQNGFAHENGTIGKLGFPMAALRAIIPTVNRLRKTCHEQKIPIYFTRMGFAADYSDAGILLDKLQVAKDMCGWVRGTWDADIIDELKPREDEIVVDKTRNTAFWGTDFAAQLASRGIDHLVVVGCATNVCVESTVRDAFTNGFYTTTVRDATATVSEEEQRVTLKTLDWFGGTATVAEVEEALREDDL